MSGDRLRELCAELHAALERKCESLEDERLLDRSAAVLRAMLAEAQPQPVEPTDEQLLETQARAAAAFPPVHPEAEPLSAVEYARALQIRKARAVLAQWGHPAPEPVSVAERLPTAADCDAEGRCWWFTFPACGPHKIRPCWTLDSGFMEGDTHWLPHWALPVPQEKTP
jgi:hypothetical protein